MHEVVGYALLMFIAVAIVSACAITSYTLQSSIARETLLLESERIVNYVIDEILHGYSLILSSSPTARVTISLDLPTNIRGYTYILKLGSSDGTHTVALTIPDRDISVNKTIVNTLPQTLIMDGQIDSSMLIRSYAYLMITSSTIILNTTQVS
ncbi:MAG: DUF7266 family protein [Candidatus Baldrarchaeia archaeon]